MKPKTMDIQRFLLTGWCHKMAHNTEIDEIKVLQNNYETFIHRSFYA